MNPTQTHKRWAEHALRNDQQSIRKAISVATRHAEILSCLLPLTKDKGLTTSEWLTAATTSKTCGRTLFYESLMVLRSTGVVRNLGTDQRPRWCLTKAGRAAVLTPVSHDVLASPCGQLVDNQ